jgi:hypothetical protein
MQESEVIHKTKFIGIVIIPLFTSVQPQSILVIT